MIHVCYGLYDKDGLYSKYTGTSITSIFENTKEKVTVHIFHDNTLTPENLNNFSQIAENYNQAVKFYNFDKICPEKIQYLREKVSDYVDSRFTVGAFFRLMIDKNLFGNDVSKIIYLDSDTVVNLDIAELWNYNIEDYAIAAVPEIEATRGYMQPGKYVITTGKVKVEDYLCSGVVVLNFDKIGKNFFYDGINWLSSNQSCECPDQDILNYFFSKNYLKLPGKFNAFINICKALDQNIIYQKIYHYAGRGYLGMDTDSEHNKLFLKYFSKTAWFNLNIFERIYQVTNQINNQGKIFAFQVSLLMNGKKRVFFTFTSLLEPIKRFVGNGNEEFVVVDENSSLEPLVKAMNKGKDKKVFFIMVDDYDTIKNYLTRAGFKEFEHFINATVFIPGYDKEDFSFPMIEAL